MKILITGVNGFLGKYRNIFFQKKILRLVQMYHQKK